MSSPLRVLVGDAVELHSLSALALNGARGVVVGAAVGSGDTWRYPIRLAREERTVSVKALNVRLLAPGTRRFNLSRRDVAAAVADVPLERTMPLNAASSGRATSSSSSSPPRSLGRGAEIGALACLPTETRIAIFDHLDARALGAVEALGRAWLVVAAAVGTRRAMWCGTTACAAAGALQRDALGVTVDASTGVDLASATAAAFARLRASSRLVARPNLCLLYTSSGEIDEATAQVLRCSLPPDAALLGCVVDATVGAPQKRFWSSDAADELRRVGLASGLTGGDLAGTEERNAAAAASPLPAASAPITAGTAAERLAAVRPAPPASSTAAATGAPLVETDVIATAGATQNNLLEPGSNVPFVSLTLARLPSCAVRPFFIPTDVLAAVKDELNEAIAIAEASGDDQAGLEHVRSVVLKKIGRAFRKRALAEDPTAPVRWKVIVLSILPSADDRVWGGSAISNVLKMLELAFPGAEVCGGIAACECAPECCTVLPPPPLPPLFSPIAYLLPTHTTHAADRGLNAAGSARKRGIVMQPVGVVSGEGGASGERMGLYEGGVAGVAIGGSVVFSSQVRKGGRQGEGVI